MRIYHFCADRHKKSIMHQGITIGGVMVPTITGFTLHSGYMWLTLDPDPHNQSWATRNAISYSRTAWRLTVEIPPEEEYKLMGRGELVEKWPDAAGLFDGWSGSDKWRVFHGMIPKKWIVKAEKME